MQSFLCISFSFPFFSLTIFESFFLLSTLCSKLLISNSSFLFYNFFPFNALSSYFISAVSSWISLRLSEFLFHLFPKLFLTSPRSFSCFFVCLGLSLLVSAFSQLLLSFSCPVICKNETTETSESSVDIWVGSCFRMTRWRTHVWKAECSLCGLFRFFFYWVDTWL